MKKVNVILSDKSLVAILCTLILIIIGLSIGIFFTQSQSKENQYSIFLPNGETVSVAASDLYYEMIEKFENEPSFIAEDAVSEFKKRIKETNNKTYAATLAIWCSKFIDGYGGGSQAALQYLENYFNNNSDNLNDSTLAEYYTLANSFAEKIDDATKMSYYEQKTKEILSKQNKEENNDGF